MNNNVFISGSIVRISSHTVNNREILNITIKSITVINDKEVVAYIPIQVSMPQMVQRYKDLPIGTMIAVEGRFESFRSNDKNYYQVTQLTSFRPFDQGHFNKVSMWGRITSDIRMNTTQNGHKVASFMIANSRSYKKEEEWVEITSFIPVVVWGEVADMATNFQKGQAVWIDGKLSSRSYENKDGVKVYVIEVNASCIVNGGSGRKNIVTDDNGNAVTPPPIQNKAPQSIPNNQGAKGLPAFPGVPTSFDGKPKTTSYPSGFPQSDFLNFMTDVDDDDLPFS